MHLSHSRIHITVGNKSLLFRRTSSEVCPWQLWLIFHSSGGPNALPFLSPSLAISMPNLLFLYGLSSAGVAQLVEHLICNQRVGGSIPSASSTRFKQGE